MALFNVFDIAGSSLTAQSQRLNVVASNIANAESVTSSDGRPYAAKQVVFEARPLNNSSPKGVAGVVVQRIIDDPTPPRLVYDPASPYANQDGYVATPNVNVVEELVNMISTSRSYQASAELMNTTKQLIQRTIALGN